MSHNEVGVDTLVGPHQSEECRVALTLRDSDSGQVTMRHLALGLDPVILIEGELGADEEVVFNIDATNIEDAGTLATLFEGLAEVLREGEVSA